MKRILLLLGVLVSLAAAQVVMAQVNEGIIQFEVKVNVHRTLPKEREEMKKIIPEFRTSKHQLLFNSNESLYKAVEEDDDEDQFNNEGGGMRMRFMQPRVEMYFNPSEEKRTAQQEFMGKEYLIDDSVKVTPWKFGTEAKTILGYDCKQATYYNEERKQNIVAWYSPKLRPFLGPEMFNTLPGGVLEVDVNEGERIISARSIEPRALKKNEIKAPEKGIKISRTEFRKMMEQQAERMRANGGNVIIRN